MSSDIFPLLWFEGVDEPWLGEEIGTMGLLTSDLQPKPAYDTYRVLVDELSGARFLRTRDDLWLRFEGYDFTAHGLEILGEYSRQALGVRITVMNSSRFG